MRCNINVEVTRISRFARLKWRLARFVCHSAKFQLTSEARSTLVKYKSGIDDLVRSSGRGRMWNWIAFTSCATASAAAPGARILSRAFTLLYSWYGIPLRAPSKKVSTSLSRGESEIEEARPRATFTIPISHTRSRVMRAKSQATTASSLSLSLAPALASSDKPNVARKTRLSSHMKFRKRFLRRARACI